MYHSNSRDYQPNGVHTYAVYKDRKTKKYRAIQLTHLYEPKKVNLIKRGYLMETKLKQFDFPTGVHSEYYDKYVNGQPLNFGRDTRHRYVGRVPLHKAKKIKKFAKRSYR